ncbi:MAG: RHS repeat-associated core domain-containing protein [Phycisphaerae bacterium]
MNLPDTAEHRRLADSAARQADWKQWGLYVDELIQQRDIDGETETDTYLLSDLLYRSVALTDDPSQGTVAVQEAYDTDAYGHTLTFSGPGNDATWFTNDDLNIDNDATRAWPLCRFGFTGRSHDYETGIYFYRARYYHQDLGRFVSRDPLDYLGGANVYAYTGCRAPQEVDPFGLWRLDGDYAVAQKGDTLWDLGQKLGTDWQNLPFQGDPRSLQIGQRINVWEHVALQRA